MLRSGRTVVGNQPLWSNLAARAACGLLLLATGLLGACGASLTGEPQVSLLSGEQKSDLSVSAGNGSPLKPDAASLGQPTVADGKPSTGGGTRTAAKAPEKIDAARAAAVIAGITPGNPGYKIGPLDVLEVSVFKVPELSKTVQVAESGSINLPLVGEVPTVGRTAQDVERDLTTKLGAKYLQSPQVTVFVKEFNSQRITVEGAVKKPGVYPLRGRTTLMQAVAMSEGMDQNVASSSIAVFHQGTGKRAATRYEIDDIRSGKAADPEIVAGDLIVVDNSPSKEAFNNFVRALPVANVLRPF